MAICPLIHSNLKQRTLNKYDAFYTMTQILCIQWMKLMINVKAYSVKKVNSI